MMQVQRLAIEVARRFANLQKLLDLRVGANEITGRRAATQRALADRQRKRIHHADERNDAAGLAIEANRLANAAHIAPIGADAASARGKPDILVPGVDDALQAIINAVQITGDRQAPAGAAVRENRRRGHEPEARDIIKNESE